jgi:hypothetical protein
MPKSWMGVELIFEPTIKIMELYLEIKVEKRITLGKESGLCLIFYMGSD